MLHFFSGSVQKVTHLSCIYDSSLVYMQRLFACNALIWKNTITILTLILFVVFLVRGLYLFAVLGKHLLKSNQGFQYQQQARDIRNSFWRFFRETRTNRKDVWNSTGPPSPPLLLRTIGASEYTEYTSEYRLRTSQGAEIDNLIPCWNVSTQTVSCAELQLP